MKTKLSIDWVELMRLFDEREKFSFGVFQSCILTQIETRMEPIECTHFGSIYKEYLPGPLFAHLRMIDADTGAEITIVVNCEFISGAPKA